MELEDKNVIIIEKINNIDIHIHALEQGILNHPDEIVEGKPLRESVLENFKNQKDILLGELTLLNT